MWDFEHGGTEYRMNGRWVSFRPVEITGQWWQVCENGHATGEVISYQEKERRIASVSL